MPTPPDFTAGTSLSVATLNQIGLWRMTPTSVAGTGVSLSGATVNFTNATAISVNGCFTADFRHYKMLLMCGGAAAGGGNLQLRLRASGSNTTGNGYYWNGGNQNGSSAIINHSGVDLAYFYVTDVLNAVADSAYCEATIFNPQQNTRTGWMNTTSFEYGADRYWRTVSGQTSFVGSYDGFTISSTGIGVTGSLRIYGYRN